MNPIRILARRAPRKPSPPIDPLEACRHSARYILEDVAVADMERLTGLPAGVIHSAFDNIFPEREGQHP